MTCLNQSRLDPQPRMGAAQWLALLAGLAAAGITAANLVGDAFVTGRFELEHVNAIVLLVATIAFGLLGKTMWAQRRLGYALAFYTVFAAGTSLVVYNSVGRQHGTAAEAEAAVQNANGALHALEADQKRADDTIAELKAELKRFAGIRSTVEIKAALDGIVGNGAGKVPTNVWRRTQSCAATEITKPESAAACEPVLALRVENGKAIEQEALRRRLDVAEAQRSKLAERIQASGGERPVPIKARGFAEVAGLMGYDAKRIEHVMSRLDKVLLALFLEIGAVFGIEFGLAGLLHPARPAPAQKTAPAPVAEAPKPTPPAGPRRTRKLTRQADETRKAKARADVLEFRRPVPQADLASRWDVGKSMVTAWLDEWELAGLVHRVRHGRMVMVHPGPRLRAVA